MANGADAARVFSASYRQALAVPMSEQPEPDARHLFLAKPEQLALQTLAVWGRPPLAWRVELSRCWLPSRRTRELGQGREQVAQNEPMPPACSVTRRARRRGGRR